MPVARKVWQHVRFDSPAALARRLTMSRALRRVRGLPVSWPVLPAADTDGEPWSASALNCRFGRLRLTLGRRKIEELGLMPPKFKRLNQGQRSDDAIRREHNEAVLERRQEIVRLALRHMPRYSLYTLRHSWCTHALERGI